MILLIIVASSCSRNTVLAPETIYDSQGKVVISSSFNRRLGNMSVLYGNKLALNSAQQLTPHHVAGEIYTLVTWKQKPMPGWYGSSINGPIETIETVQVLPDEQGNISFSYQLLKGHSLSDKQKRIDFIIHQKASIFP